MFLSLPKRALALLAASLGAAALAGCEDTGVSNRGARPHPARDPGLDGAGRRLQGRPDAHPRLQKGGGARGLEDEAGRALRQAQDLSDVPLVGTARPETREGDRQVPEGFYAIAPGQLNPNSSYYLSFNVGYPNAYDRAHGSTGGTIMVHGACSSAGCFSMTDRANRRDLRHCAQLAQQWAACGADAVLSLPHDGGEFSPSTGSTRTSPSGASSRKDSDHFETTLKGSRLSASAAGATSSTLRRLTGESSTPRAPVRR